MGKKNCRDGRTRRRAFMAMNVLGAACACVSTASRAQEPEAAAAPIALQPVLVPGKRPTDVGPLPGLGVTKDQIPANIQSATKEEIKASRSLNLGDFLNAQMQGVSVNDYAGNPFQLDVNYRGFTASPQVGTPQGLSVFFDGVRVNEPFGDVVNWDLIPLNAIERFDLFPGSNPLFGLNTLGGAISVRSKNGFTSPGLEAEALAGSWGRRQVKLSGGANDGSFAGFGAYTGFREDGWRDDSPSRVNQLFGRGDWRLERGSVFVTGLYADNRLIGNGLIPLALFEARPETVFTSPDESVNRVRQFTVGGQLDLSEQLSLTGQVYSRKSRRSGLNGDVYEGFDEMTNPLDGGVFDPARPDLGIRPRNGAFYNLPGVIEGTPIGLLTSSALDQDARGFSLQLNLNSAKHSALLGASLDRSGSSYRMAQRLGLIDAAHRVYAAPDELDYAAARTDIQGNNFDGTSITKSLYASDTWTLSPTVVLTTAARLNHTIVDNHLSVRAAEANVDLHELPAGYDNAQTQTAEQFTYRSFNPSIGINWLPTPGLNTYANVSRGARTPSVVELGCAFDDTPVPATAAGDPTQVFGTTARSLVGPGCNLPTTLSGDPYLPQIRSTSFEVGARGVLAANWEWNASVFQTDLKDDIYFVGVGQGRSYFDTVGKTRRRGIELGLKGAAGPFDMKAGYSYTDATFESPFYVLSASNSSADFDQNSRINADLGYRGYTLLPTAGASLNGGRGTYRQILVEPGARLPGIPAHALNLSLGYKPTPGWRIGLTMQARSLSYVRGNENNLHQPGGTDQETGQYYCQSTCLGSEGFLQTSTRPARPFTQKGTVPGFAIFGFDTSVELAKGLTLFLQVTNLFDRAYYTAGRLGVNPFSPSTVGAIGSSGWNYNSAEWQQSTFVGPGAPRAIFMGLSYALDAN